MKHSSQHLKENKSLIALLKQGGVVVMPTDTIYGIVGQALNQEVFERIYSLRQRNPAKPCIILISDINELKKFNIDISLEQEKKLKEIWSFDSAQDKPTSVVLDCPDERFKYLHRGTETLAFRIPKNENLRELLKETGPLVAPSANLEGAEPAKNINEARKYFGPSTSFDSTQDKPIGVDLYVDGGEIAGQASRVIKLNTDGSKEILRV